MIGFVLLRHLQGGWGGKSLMYYLFVTECPSSIHFLLHADICRRREHFSSWMRLLRLWMQPLSTRMRPSLRGRGSWERLPACSPSGRWILWPNSVTCLPLRPELCCASTSTRSVHFFSPCSHLLYITKIDVDLMTKWQVWQPHYCNWWH